MPEKYWNGGELDFDRAKMGSVFGDVVEKADLHHG